MKQEQNSDETFEPYAPAQQPMHPTIAFQRETMESIVPDPQDYNNAYPNQQFDVEKPTDNASFDNSDLRYTCPYCFKRQKDGLPCELKSIKAEIFDNISGISKKDGLPKIWRVSTDEEGLKKIERCEPLQLQLFL